MKQKSFYKNNIPDIFSEIHKVQLQNTWTQYYVIHSPSNAKFFTLVQQRNVRLTFAAEQGWLAQRQS